MNSFRTLLRHNPYRILDYAVHYWPVLILVSHCAPKGYPGFSTANPLLVPQARFDFGIPLRTKGIPGIPAVDKPVRGKGRKLRWVGDIPSTVDPSQSSRLR